MRAGSVMLVLTAFVGCGAVNPHTVALQANRDEPRNIILIIGDGMGPQQLALSELYWHRTQDAQARPLHEFLVKANTGVHLPLPHSSLVNDSACAASQLAGECRCEPKQIGMSFDGAPCSSVLREARGLGMKVGIVSDTRLTHATPAAFYGYAQSRELEDELAKQLVFEQPDIALSGGANFFLPEKSHPATQTTALGQSCSEGAVGRRKDTVDLLSQAHKQGAQVVRSLADLNAATATPLLGVFAPDYMANAFREGEDNQPTLARMTERALELLANPEGFFLMVEAGQIDTAGHLNDAGWVLAEMLRLSSVLRVVDTFVQSHPDTLVVLTADHETGGMGLSYRRAAENVGHTSGPAGQLDFLSKQNLLALKGQKTSIADLVGMYELTKGAEGALAKLQEKLAEATGIVVPLDELRTLVQSRDTKQHLPIADAVCSHDRNTFYPYAGMLHSVRVAQRIAESQGVVWATGTHTSTPVTIAATGPQSQSFRGWMNTEHVGQRLLQVLRGKK